MQYVQAIVDGLLIGTTYSLIGIGFALIFGVMHKINLAYAAAAIAAAYASLVVWRKLGLPLPAVLAVAALASGGIGYLVYLTCFRFIPLRNPLATLMATVGMLIFLDEVVIHASDGKGQDYAEILFGVNWEVAGLSIRAAYVAIFAIGVLAMLALLYLLYRTRLGIATRAVAQRPVAAQLCGISIESTNALTFAIAGVLGGLAGALVGSTAGQLSPLITVPLTVKGLIVTVIGGLGSIPGAIVAGLLVGAAEQFFEIMTNVHWRDMMVMALLFAFLVFRPKGLFGRVNVRD
jgi:branched-chain amino acid transport system permease protein